MGGSRKGEKWSEQESVVTEAALETSSDGRTEWPYKDIDFQLYLTLETWVVAGAVFQTFLSLSHLLSNDLPLKNLLTLTHLKKLYIFFYFDGLILPLVVELARRAPVTNWATPSSLGGGQTKCSSTTTSSFTSSSSSIAPLAKLAELTLLGFFLNNPKVRHEKKYFLNFWSWNGNVSV